MLIKNTICIICVYLYSAHPLVNGMFISVIKLFIHSVCRDSEARDDTITRRSLDLDFSGVVENAQDLSQNKTSSLDMIMNDT